MSLGSGSGSLRNFLISEDGLTLKELVQFRMVKECLLWDLRLWKIGIGRERQRGRGRKKERVESERGDATRARCIVL